jgi:hypothetical protein
MVLEMNGRWPWQTSAWSAGGTADGEELTD